MQIDANVVEGKSLVENKYETSCQITFAKKLGEEPMKPILKDTWEELKKRHHLTCGHLNINGKYSGCILDYLEPTKYRSWRLKPVQDRWRHQGRRPSKTPFRDFPSVAVEVGQEWPPWPNQSFVISQRNNFLCSARLDNLGPTIMSKLEITKFSWASASNSSHFATSIRNTHSTNA